LQISGTEPFAQAHYYSHGYFLGILLISKFLGALPYQCQFCEKRFNRMDNQLTHEINIHNYSGYPKVPAFITRMNERTGTEDEMSELSGSQSPSLKHEPADEDDTIADETIPEPDIKKFKPSETEKSKSDLDKKSNEPLPKFSQMLARSQSHDLAQPSTSNSKLEAYLATSSFKKGYINFHDLEHNRSPSQGSASDHSLSSGLYAEQVPPANQFLLSFMFRHLAMKVVAEGGKDSRRTKNKKF